MVLPYQKDRLAVRMLVFPERLPRFFQYRVGLSDLRQCHPQPTSPRMPVRLGFTFWKLSRINGCDWMSIRDVCGWKMEIILLRKASINDQTYQLRLSQTLSLSGFLSTHCEEELLLLQ